MKLLNFIFIKLTSSLFIGIVISKFITLSIYHLVGIIFSLLCVLFCLNWHIKNTTKHSFYYGITAYITFILVGVFIVRIHDEKLYSNHYLALYSNSNNITLKIRTVLKPSLYHDKYIANISKIGNKKATGKILLNIKKADSTPKLEVDDIYITTDTLSVINAPLNPNQFDYKTYLENRYIYKQIYSEHAFLFPVSKEKHTLLGYTAKIHSSINKQLSQFNFKPNELAIIKALITGQRQDIRSELATQYKNAGAIHILAISGLHVGILFLIINALSKPLNYIKHGSYIKSIVCILLLWLFAVITGLSASVTRAVTMFSILTVAINLKRPTNSYNTLVISIFFLILFKPLIIYDIGFQLSYLAVFAIISIYPLLNNLWNPKFWIVKKLWNIFSITIAAQCGVLPLSIYYFHQLPGLFFITNLLLIPFLGFVFGFGLIIIILALIDFLPESLANTYGYIINLMNSFIELIASQEQFIIKTISLSIFQLLALYLLIIMVVRFFMKTNYKRLQLLFVSIIILQISFIYAEYNSVKKRTFTIFHISRKTLITKKQNKTLMVYSNLDSTKLKTTLKNYNIANRIKTITPTPLSSVFMINSNTLLVIDSLNTYAVKQFKPHYILLRNSPKINLNRVIDSLQPKQVIADGSNYKSYIKHWKTLCEKRKLPFHYTGEKGAFIIETK